MKERVEGSLLGVSTGARVAEHVRGLIWQGRLRAGDRVGQEEIATALGVSRIPVREGLVALASEGLVRHEPQRGVFVVGLDRAFIQDHYALLGVVLGYVIEQAAARADARFAAELEDLRRRVEPARSAARLFPLAVEFKQLVCRVGGSARAQAAVGSLERLVPGNLHAEVPGAIEVTRSGIAAIADAIARGDGVRAGAETRSMTRRLGDAVLSELERRGRVELDESKAVPIGSRPTAARSRSPRRRR